MPSPVVISYTSKSGVRAEVYCQMVSAKSPDFLTVYAVYPMRLIDGTKTLIYTSLVAEPMQIPLDSVTLIRSLSEEDHVRYSMLLLSVTNIH